MTLTPYLAVRDARAALAWYAEAFGARVVGDPYVMDDNRIGHAELDIGGARVYLSDEHPELGVVAPEPGRVSVGLHLSVPDVDTAIAGPPTPAPPWIPPPGTSRTAAPAWSSTPSGTAGCCRHHRRRPPSHARRCAPATPST